MVGISRFYHILGTENVEFLTLIVSDVTSICEERDKCQLMIGSSSTNHCDDALISIGEDNWHLEHYLRRLMESHTHKLARHRFPLQFDSDLYYPPTFISDMQGMYLDYEIDSHLRSSSEHLYLLAKIDYKVDRPKKRKSVESPNNKSHTPKVSSNLHKQDIPRASDFSLRVVLGKGSFGKVVKMVLFGRLGEWLNW
ncbi:hypothetical protein ACTXT7_002727 [Hymenolepis weldensis]